jgi:hypothetical protein
MWVNAIRLPAEYQEVEYIQSSGDVYVNTQFSPNQNTKAEIKINNWTEVWSYDIFWTDRGFANSWFTILSTVPCFWNQTIDVTTNVADWNMHIIELSQSWYVVDGNLITTFNTQTFNSLNLYIFALNRNGGAREYSHYKFYYMKLWDNWTLVRDFVPCYRKSDNVIWMYDLVNNQFYTNSWTWAFTKWANIPDMVEKQVRPSRSADYELYYDLKWGTLAGLQAAWFDEIWTSGSYTFASDWLQQTSSSNDRWTWVIKKWLDLTNARKFIASSVWKWQYASWSNGKEIKLCTDIITSSNDITLVNPRRDTYCTYSSNNWYRNSELPYVHASWTSTVLASGIATSASWEDTMTLTIDFENKTIEWKVAWTNNYTLSANLTDEQYNATRNMTAVLRWWWRWYSSYDSYERLKEIYLKIEY